MLIIWVSKTFESKTTAMGIPPGSGLVKVTCGISKYNIKISTNLGRTGVSHVSLIAFQGLP